MASQDDNSQITQEQFLKNYPNVTLVQTPSKAANNPKKQSPGKATIIPSPSQHALKQQTPSVPKAIPKLPQNISLKPATPNRQMGANVGKVKQNTPAVSSSAVNVPVSVKTVQQAVSPAKSASTPKSLPTAKAQVVKTPNVVQNHALTATNMIQSPIIANQTVRNKSPMTPRAGIAAKPQLKSFTSNTAAALAMKTQAVRTPLNRALVRAKNPNQANSPRPDVALLNKTPTRPPVPPAVPIGKPKEQSLTTASAITTYQSLPQCKSKQITITPTGASNKVIVQQVIHDNGQLVIQREVEPVGTSAQSVTVGTTGQTVASLVKQSASATPQTLEITSSEPVKTIQVTQQVTLISKGNTFNVEDVKKQINQQKQNTMTNIVSSTTNSIPAAAQLVVQNQLVEQKKIVAPASEGGEIAAPPSPVRKVVRPSCATPRQQYPTTQGQVRKVATPVSRPTKDIPMQKVSPMTMMPPPSLPLPELQNHFANEEEVTTSEETPQASDNPTKIVFILPDGQRQEILINAKLPVNLLVRDILDSTTLKKYAGVVTCIPPTINITSNLPNETEGTQWQAGAEANLNQVLNLVKGAALSLDKLNYTLFKLSIINFIDKKEVLLRPEPGEITGIVHSNDPEELEVEAGASEEAESAGKEDELEKNSQAVVSVIDTLLPFLEKTLRFYH